MLRVRYGGSSAKGKSWSAPEFCKTCGRQIPVKKTSNRKQIVTVCNRCKAK